MKTNHLFFFVLMTRESSLSFAAFQQNTDTRDFHRKQGSFKNVISLQHSPLRTRSSPIWLKHHDILGLLLNLKQTVLMNVHTQNVGKGFHGIQLKREQKQKSLHMTVKLDS